LWVECEELKPVLPANRLISLNFSNTSKWYIYIYTARIWWNFFCLGFFYLDSYFLSFFFPFLITNNQVEKLKHDEKETKKLQDSLQSLQLRLAAREHICRSLQEKVIMMAWAPFNAFIYLLLLWNMWKIYWSCFFVFLLRLLSLKWHF
jgi:hypothetical protein